MVGHDRPRAVVAVAGGIDRHQDHAGVVVGVDRPDVAPIAAVPRRCAWWGRRGTLPRVSAGRRLPFTSERMYRWPGHDGITIAGDSWGDPAGPLMLLQQTRESDAHLGVDGLRENGTSARHRPRPPAQWPGRAI